MRLKIFGVSLIAIVLSASSVALAQSYVESALQFSRTKPWGSARIQGVGGAQIALGGDYSSAVSNPAGIGMYNRSEFTFSPGLLSYNTTSDYMGNSEKQSGSKFILPGISLVFHIPSERESDIGFKGGSLAISMSRTNDFNRSVSYQGTNPNSSIIDSFIDNATGATTEQFEEGNYNYNTPTGLAYYNFLIGPRSTLPGGGPDDEYFTDAHKIPFQKEEIETSGSTSQWNFAYGANFNDILFIGAGVGISSLRFKTEKRYSEDFDDPDTLLNLTLREKLLVRGSGINATIGATVRPVTFFQVGIAYTTPTYYSLSETYNASMSTRWDNFDYYGDGKEILGDNSNDPVVTDDVISDYSLTTPGRFSVGVAFLSKYGFITGDFEMSNPAKAKYSSTQGFSFSQENSDIKAIYKRAISYRLGAEFRYNMFRVRAGYGVQGNTLASNMNFNNEIKTISGGVGIKRAKFFIDFALSNNTAKAYYNPYYLGDFTPTVDMKHSFMASTLTFGFTF
jgi:hypothetical protein